jgi:competence protein ComEC
MVIATHPDMDHIGGFLHVLPRYAVATIVDNGVEKSTPESIKWRELEKEERDISGQKSAILNIFHDDIIPIGDGVTLRILHPEKSDPWSETNNNSIVIRLEYGDFSALFTGDLDSGVEMDMIDRVLPEMLNVDMLKVPHHGSKYSSSMAFIKRTSPELAIISVACNNDYGHPHPGSLKRYAFFKVPVLTTCDKGTIHVISNGNGFRLEK